jgi:hypothetical protein
MIPVSWYVAGGMAVALAGTSWLLYDAIEDKGQLRAEIASKQAEVDRLADTVKRQETEAAVRQSIHDAADRAVVSVETGRDIIRGRVVTIIREVRSAPDASDPVPQPLSIALEQLRRIEAGDGGGDQDRSPGATPGPPARP